MADNDQNDEYRFSELDSDNESMDNADYGSNGPKSTGSTSLQPQKNVRRNALIAVGLIVFAMLMYKLIGGVFSGKSSNEAAKGAIPSAPIVEAVPQQPQPVQAIQSTHPEVAVQPVPSPAVQENNSALKEKVDAIETNQQAVQSQVSSMNEQVGNVNNNITNLSSQINSLNQTITDLTNQLSRQSEEINVLRERTKPKPVRRIIRPRHVGQANIYYINAVIPGRAWLIATNGSTLTVREGTKISGYGVVKLIDSMSGRILTSSGRVIRFSQDDS